MFDGVHSGHLQIIERLIDSAQKRKERSVLVTFDSHPQSTIKNNQTEFRLLTPLKEKMVLLEGLGVDVVLVLPFTEQFAATDAESFVQESLFNKVGIREFIIGYSHAFGKNRKGNAELLRQLGSQLGFTVEVVMPVHMDNEIVNSTIIRQLISEGSVRKAKRFLGRNYCISGVVIKGINIGEKIGFPTANMDLTEKTKWIPRDGVYAGWVRLSGQIFTGMIDIGFSPTVEGKHWGIEAYLHNFNGDLYGHQMDLFFVDRIRDELKFDSIDTLVSQIKLDEEKSLEILSEN
jgi:riboflavin kinase/FMN adenylyltransferase